MRDWGDGHMGDGWGLVMFLGMLSVGVMVALAVGLAVLWAVRHERSTARESEAWAGPTPPSVTSGAERILAERLARGEIDTEEYAARLEAVRTPRMP